MTAHSPDDRLSAFYDGELSAVERAEVERLLTANPGLRAELNTLTGLSQQLEDLADDLPEVDLRPRVMQRIAASRPATASSTAPSRRRWMPVILTVCSLALLVAVAWPLLSHSDNSITVTDHQPPAPTMNDLAASMKAASTAGMESDAPGESVASIDSPVTVSPIAPQGMKFGSVMEGRAGSHDSLDGTGPSELLARIERRRDLKPGDIFSQMFEDGGVPMIADYTVIDVRRTARDVEFLLQKKGILPLLASDLKKNSESTVASKQRDISSPPAEFIKVYLVDAESASLNTAIVECQNLQEVVALNVEPLGPYDAGDTLFSQNKLPAQAAADPVAAGSLPSAPAPPSAAMPGPVAAPVGNDPADLNSRVNAKTSLVNGNSIVIENGDEFYSEIMQRQMQSLKNAERNDGPKQQSKIEVPAIPGRNATPPNPLESFSNSTQQFEGRQGNNGYSYNNSLNGGRSRQRAILVLRSQSPPPPPESTRIAP